MLKIRCRSGDEDSVKNIVALDARWVGMDECYQRTVLIQALLNWVESLKLKTMLWEQRTIQSEDQKQRKLSSILYVDVCTDKAYFNPNRISVYEVQKELGRTT